MGIFKRQSGQMKAVVAEAIEALEATKEVIAKIKSEPPEALTLPPPPPNTPSVRYPDTGRYTVLSGQVPRPAKPPVPTKPVAPSPPKVIKPSPQVPRPAIRPAPPKPSSSETDE